jgi:hypothetical protein
VGEIRLLPADLQVGHETGHQDQVDRSITDHLIGDADPADPGVSGFRPHGSHCTWWSPTAAQRESIIPRRHWGFYGPVKLRPIQGGRLEAHEQQTDDDRGSGVAGNLLGKQPPNVGSSAR